MDSTSEFDYICQSTTIALFEKLSSEQQDVIVRAGGYILGDEGSGAVLGKMFLSDVLKGLAPKDVTADF